jgi:uncharacterized protein YdeI (YjbR/CyaY-like superfamily)
MSTASPSNDRLTRDLQPMPDFVRDAIKQRGLTGKYEARPAYQRNDYLMWINEAQREDTKLKRLNQMLDELERGDVYMRMKWNSGD